VKDYDIRIVRPCADDPDFNTAHADLKAELDMDAVCDMMENDGNARVSRVLGVVKFDVEGSDITVYRNGRVDMRKVRDMDHARRLMETLEERFCAYLRGAAGDVR